MTKPISRFEGPSGRSTLLDALGRQTLLRGPAVLEVFADRGKLRAVTKGEKLIEQGNWDTEVYFILVGAFNVVINNQHQTIREAGTYVGELAGLKGSRARSATLVARQESLVLQVSYDVFNELVGNDPEVWKRAFDNNADRLAERNQEIGSANEKSRIFVISSSEGIPVARQVENELINDDVIVNLWNKGTFGLSNYAISDLEDAIEAADFTLSVVRPDDTVIRRSKKMSTARDNVVLEFGISVGKLGRVRSLLLVEASEQITLPSDTAGLTTLRYRHGKNQGEMERTVAVACNHLRKHVEQHGPRQNRRNCP